MSLSTFVKKLEPAAVYGLPIVWLFAIMLLFNNTSPLQSGPLSVLTAFVFIYLFVSSLLYMIVSAIMAILKLLSITGPINKRLTYDLTSVIALGPVFLLALNTLNQLDIKDIVLVVVLIGLGCFYVVRRNAKTSL